MKLTAARLKYVIAWARARLHQSRAISAMLRVKNEEEFLFASVTSIVEHVDEVVIVDNGSRDETPAVIDALRERYPDKVSRHSYPFEIRRVGRENWELAS